MPHCEGRLQALPTSIRTGRKGLPVTNTVAHYETELNTTVKMFLAQATGLSRLGE
jgi:hypothetical protein